MIFDLRSVVFEIFIDLKSSIIYVLLSIMSDTAAIELLKRAVQLDGEQKYPDALTCYSEGIRMLLKAVKGKICKISISNDL